jgi:hypothetical protein
VRAVRDDCGMFRFFTQNIRGTDDHEIIRILREHGFPYCTIVGGTGWGPDQGGKPENSLVVDIAVENYDSETEKRMMAAVEEIKKANRQSTVFLVRIALAKPA